MGKHSTAALQTADSVVADNPRQTSGLSIEETRRRQEEFTTRAAEYIPHLTREALRLTRNPDDAEDLVQETFLKALRACHRLRRDTNLRAWLSRIMLNSWINRHRRQKRQPALVSWDESPWQAETSTAANTGPVSPEPQDAVLSDVLDEELEGALKSLPPQFRQVLLLASLGELSYDDVARKLNIPVGTVRSRLFRARSLLREALHGFGAGRNTS